VDSRIPIRPPIRTNQEIFQAPETGSIKKLKLVIIQLQRRVLRRDHFGNIESDIRLTNTWRQDNAIFKV
jgi:hypothetical protein